ncbi:MAG TPA: hypothetical protein VF278_04120 [Pirellulales bacterium]
MRCRLLASIVILALGAVDNAQGDWRNYPTNRAGLNGGRQRGNRRLGYTPYTDWRADGAANRAPAANNSRNGSLTRADWRAYGAVNRVSPDGVWQRGYGRMGYGWYSAYGDYVGSDYSTIGFGNRNRASGFNFNRTDNYGFIDPRAIGDRPR